ncbi:MAG: glycosyltransferase family 4 protein [Muribaculaceae bacterium]|nr:glycosyltransferase family 4 protein [Muribaculaceae bacterium]
MTANSSRILSRVLFAGPDLRSRGGIASVMGLYKKALGEITYLPTTHFRNKALSILAFAMAMIKLPFYRMKGFDTLHAHGSVRGSWTRKSLLLDWARFLGMRTVHHIHNGALQRHFASIGPEKVARSLRKRDTVVALTQGWADYLRREFGLTNVVVIENPVEFTGVTRKENNSGKLRLLFLSIIDHTKGLDELLAAIADHKDELQGRVHLDVGGDGSGYRDALDFIARNGIENIVSIHGWMSGEPKARLIESNDVFVLPSYAEGQPMSLLEAMAAGLAAIVTPVGGMAEVIADGVNGIYVTPKDSETIFEAIKFFIDHRDVIPEMGRKNRVIAAKFLPERVAEKVIALHKSLQEKKK